MSMKEKLNTVISIAEVISGEYIRHVKKGEIPDDKDCKGCKWYEKDGLHLMREGHCCNDEGYIICSRISETTDNYEKGA